MLDLRTRVAHALLAACLGLLLAACSSDRQDPGPALARSVSAEVAVDWFELQLELIRQSPGFSPPVASRALGYSGVALYEALVAGMPEHRSLAGTLNGLTSPPSVDPRAGYHWGLVANAALAAITRVMYPVAPQAQQDRIDRLEESRRSGFAFATDVDTAARSIAHGRSVAQWIAAWSLNDGGAYGHLTNGSPGYSPPVGPGLWEPTPPAFAPALQARWGENRTFCLESGAACQPGPHPPYSTDPASAFHAEALEVYETVNGLTADQLAIARFWADDPGQTATPPGHWIAILDAVVAQQGSSLELAAEAYCKIGITVADSFVSCWYSKFDQNLLRPITYIRTNLDAGWTPPVNTPPFPEYTSGHSVQSAAAAAVLTDLFGEGFAFTDDSHARIGLPARAFGSFREAAAEAAVSRLYGGIHYRSAIDAGLEQGEAIGREVKALPVRRTEPGRPLGPLASSYDDAVATAWFGLSLELVRTTPGFSPPVASRALGYAGVALYEAVRPGQPALETLAGQLNGLTMLPAPRPGQQYHWPSAANAALARIHRHLFPTATPDMREALDSLEQDLEDGLRTGQAVATLERSRAFGEQVADAVYFWSRTDGGHEGFLRNFPTSYTPPTGPGLWVPTAPGFQPALQPYWGDNRPFALRSSASCEPGAPPPYSEAVGSTFHTQALEVAQTVAALTPAQLEIARWWSDDPGTTATPPGHSISMLTQVLVQTDARLDLAAEAYARVGIAVADAFVSCWRAKFDYNLLRPITYIQAWIDPAFAPPLGTPPFPEYTSGHSVQSGAWAEVMTAMFGRRFDFTDRTNEFLGLGARSFSSFYGAAEEAAISRLYGGIHFRAAIDIGVQQGRCVGQQVNGLTFRR
jgi:membrane-associated phospholipid phosphatase